MTAVHVLHIAGQHDSRLVAVSVVIAIIAAYAALDLPARVTAPRGHVRLMWLVGASLPDWIPGARLLLPLAAWGLLVLPRPLSAQQLDPTVQVRGFGDFNYLETERDLPSGFREGQLVGHLAAGLTDRAFFFGEMSATAQSAGFTVEVERAILRYDFSDRFKLSAGRYHTPVSYWNTAFHHGQWLQTTVGRPEMIRFGGSFLPVHFVGVLAEGALPSSSLGLGYAVGLGNGRSTNLARGGDAGDANGQRAVVFNLYARPPGLLGWQAGASLYLDRASTAADTSVGERIFSAHLAYEKESPEVLAEYARVWHDPLSTLGGEIASQAYYLQLAYRLPGRMQALKPYLRFERLDLSARDALLAPLVPDSRTVTGGVRYDFAPMAALKVEYRSDRSAEDGYASSLALQLSFTFPGPGTHGGPGYGTGVPGHPPSEATR